MENLTDIRAWFMSGRRSSECRSRRLQLERQAEVCQCAIYRCMRCGKEFRYACVPIMFEPNAWELVDDHIKRDSRAQINSSRNCLKRR